MQTWYLKLVIKISQKLLQQVASNLIMSRLSGENLNKSYFIFSSYCPLQIWALETCNQDIYKIIIASSFKHGQLVDDD